MKIVCLLLISLTIAFAIPVCNPTSSGDYALTFSEKPLRLDPNKICVHNGVKDILIDIITKKTEDAEGSEPYDEPRKRTLPEPNCLCETAADLLGAVNLVTETIGEKIKVVISSVALQATILDCIIPHDYVKLFHVIKQGKIFLITQSAQGAIKIRTFLQSPTPQLLPEKFLSLTKPDGYSFTEDSFDLDLVAGILRISVSKDGVEECLKVMCYTFDLDTYIPCLIGIDVVVDLRIRRAYKISDDLLNVEILDMDRCTSESTLFSALSDVSFVCPNFICSKILSDPLNCQIEEERDEHNCATDCFEGGPKCLLCNTLCILTGIVDDISDLCIQGLFKPSCEPGPLGCKKKSVCTCGRKRINAIESCPSPPDGCVFKEGPTKDEDGCITQCPSLSPENLQCDCSCDEKDKPSLKEILQVDFRCPSIDAIKFRCNTDQGCSKKRWEYSCDCPVLSSDILAKCNSAVPEGFKRQSIKERGCLIGCRDIKIPCAVEDCQKLASVAADIIVGEERDGICPAKSIISLKCGRSSNDECKEWEVNCCGDEHDKFRAECKSNDHVIAKPYTDRFGCFAGCAFQCREDACLAEDLEFCDGADTPADARKRRWPCVANSAGECGWTDYGPCNPVECAEGERLIHGKCFGLTINVGCSEVDFDEADEGVSIDELLLIKILRELTAAGIKEKDDFEIEFEKIDLVTGVVSFVIGVLTEENAVVCKDSVSDSTLFVGSASVEGASSESSAASRLSSFL